VRPLLCILLVAGCQQRPDWESKQPCTMPGLHARVDSLTRNRLARLVYRVGRHLGMEEPRDHLTVRVCNGTDARLYVWHEERPRPWWVDLRGNCHWTGGLASEIGARRALLMSYDVPASDAWFESQEVNIPWATHPQKDALECGLLRAQ
jgi:hypothetical protein